MKPVFSFIVHHSSFITHRSSSPLSFLSAPAASRDVEYSLLQDWGHLDVLLGTAAAQQVFAPLADWIDRHTPAPSP